MIIIKNKIDNMYIKKDFNNLQFNPLCENDILKEYAKLNEIIKPEFIGMQDLDKILRYTIMIYDRKSILVVQEKDMNYRKGIAADLAEFNQDSDYRGDIFTLRNKIAFELAIRYLTRFDRSHQFAAYCAIEFKFWESIRKLITPIEEGTANAELQAVPKKSNY